jgi:hypothetical protein
VLRAGYAEDYVVVSTGNCREYFCICGSTGRYKGLDIFVPKEQPFIMSANNPSIKGNSTAS